MTREDRKTLCYHTRHIFHIEISTTHPPKTADCPVVHLEHLNIYDPTIQS